MLYSCFILQGEVPLQGAALRLLQPAKWHRPVPSSGVHRPALRSPQSQKPGKAELLLLTSMSEVTAGCSVSIFHLPQKKGPICISLFQCFSW